MLGSGGLAVLGTENGSFGKFMKIFMNSVCCIVE